MDHWPYKIGTYNHELVRKFCVEDKYWQKFRLSLKGLPTTQKLERLDNYRRDCLYYDFVHGLILLQRNQVQIDNYINALKRGGQLDIEGKVQR